MSVQITLDIPESAFSVIRQTPKIFAKELLMAAVVKWYELGMVSQSKAAEITGISREEFLTTLCKFNITPFQTTLEELKNETSNE